VVPGFVDAHTHLAFAGDRDDEIRQRLAGASYQQIAAAGGGIVKTVGATRAASAGDLAALVEARLDEMLLCGTTTAEVKSGYGLETPAEIRSLEAIRDAAALHPVGVVPTFLGAHEVPPEHRASRERYVELLIDEMIPASPSAASRSSPTCSARRASSASTRAGASCSRRASVG
jgi:imidazolonepropionase